MRLWLGFAPLLFAFSVYSEGKEDYGQHVIGIDLGTTYSCVGVFKNGKVDIILNEQGNRITPSYVAFDEQGNRFVGDPAKSRLTEHPENTIFDAKRLMGRKFRDASVQSDMKFWPFTVVDKNDKPHISVNVGGVKKDFAAEEISAMVLSKMKDIAEKFLETNITHAVVTVPAYFDDAQRTATKDAGTIAGLNVLRIINEPTAAAIAYGFNKKSEEQNVLVFDLGGGTFDVSVLAIDNGVFEVLATNGDNHLGGQDFDNTVTDYLIEEIKRKVKKDVRNNKRAVQKIKREAEKAKRGLSKHHKVDIELEDLTKDGTVNYFGSLTRAKFEELNSKAFKSTIKPVEKVLEDAELTINDISEVILVGGSTRIPKIQALVKEFFNGKEPNRGINPDEAVAYGAAIQAAILTGYEETQDLVLLDVNPFSLGIETQGGIMTVMIKRNTKIPTKQSSIFSTVQDNQEHVQINVHEGERSMAKDNKLLGQFMLTDIAKAPRGQPQIEVTFHFDQNGILHVSAEDKKTAKKNNITITSSNQRPSQEEIDRMIKDAEAFAEQDKLTKERIEAKLSLEQTAYQISSKLDESQKPEEKLSKEEIAKAKSLCEEVLKWVSDNQEATTKEYNEKKEKFTKDVEEIVKKLGGDQFQKPPEPNSAEGDQADEL